MKIGELKNPVVIKRWQDVPVGAFNINQTVDAGVQVWAKIENVGNAIFWGTKQIGEGVTHRMIMRRSEQVDENSITGEHVIEFNNERYRVKRVADYYKEQSFVMVECEKLGAV